ncbi:phage holin family protein [Limibacter armeniacum]|uniref:phage holin family protein n=1 Tax=Limibacter armeniacum TaxID=466084 RepID=UPI002FE5A44F
MKKLIVKFLVSGIAVFTGAYMMESVGSGVTIDNYWTAIVVAVVISLINLFIKPILFILTLPITIITLGLFLIILNSFTFYLAGKLVDGFEVPGIFTAIVFSLLYSIAMTILENVLGLKEGED